MLYFESVLKKHQNDKEFEITKNIVNNLQK